MNNELAGQMIAVRQKLKQIEASIEDGNHNFGIYRSHWRKLKKELKTIKGKRLEIENLYSEIERSEQMLKCMQSQQLKIVKKFIMKVRQKRPEDYIHFPRRLSPYLDVIDADDRLVRDLGEIIVPIHLNHLKSDRQSLLKGIIATANEKLAIQGKTVDVPNETISEHKNEHPQKCPEESHKKPAIVVKVRKSSISILSSTSLTRESVQNIIENVEMPLRARNASKQATSKDKRKVRLLEQDKTSDNLSASDIKIIFMPKRKMNGQISEPCRTIEESDSNAKVPPRRCKSTDAVLIKTKKTKGIPECHKASKLSRDKICNKRSSSVVTVEKKSENISQPVDTIVSEHNKAALSMTDAACKEKEETKIKHDDAETNKNASNKEDDLEFGKGNSVQKLSPGATLTETASLLKLIYENLEEERNSTHCLDKKLEKSEWKNVDENNNELLKDITDNGKFSENDSDSQTPRRPQFYKVDKRGIARPESPYCTNFREPSFLSNSQAPNLSEKCFMNTYFVPDEENQLDALSPEEKFLLLTEHEAFLSSRRYSEISQRKPMFHGIPACLGMPNGHGMPACITALPNSQNIPFYLKKWEQQLTSRKVLKAIPRRIGLANGSIRSTRLTNSPKSKRPHDSSPLFRLQGNSSYQRHPFNIENGSPVNGICLPPLSMFPAKRPSTAQCSNSIPINHQHREGPEREVSRIIDYNDNVWK